jgi:thioesterase domain-containing protein/2-polyprenyl-3-methyl-5-hydroxy-6-metoxy-1,4-benzoquinol methylase/acyl carrier protein
LQPVAQGLVGEIYIGGAGLARGYLNRPELTAEKFIHNPFSNQPEDRLYRTGDLARYLPDGTLQYLGRVDHQVKVRGYRIEPGEIEATLKSHPAVRDAVVVARQDHAGEPRLVAYMIGETTDTNAPSRAAEWQLEHVASWAKVWTETYGQTKNNADPAFNTVGWNSSYTGQPIPEGEMREWVERTVERIVELNPDRVLEIGCGSGLLLQRIAPQCAYYCGTEVSTAALADLQRQIKCQRNTLPQIDLRQATADDLNWAAAESFDTVIINSVVQYFPDISYLFRVLQVAVGVVKSGGAIFLGDIRNLPLLQVFHTSVQLHHATPALTVDEFFERVREHQDEEKELVVDPAFFIALGEYLPRINRVDIQLKPGRARNEITKFRYDVVLHVGPERCQVQKCRWLDWETEKLDLGALSRMLSEGDEAALGIMRVPNARLYREVSVLNLLARAQRGETIGQLRSFIAEDEFDHGIEPEDFWSLRQKLPYSVEVGYSSSGADGYFDVLFTRLGKTYKAHFPSAEMANFSANWERYGNNPLKRMWMRRLVPQLRNYLEERLPWYMVPSAYVTLNEFPRTPNGKLDRNALPAPDRARPELQTSYVAPSDGLEEVLAGIWEKLLDLQRVGVNDDFFELGGHSLLAVQLFSEIKKEFGHDLPLATLLRATTIRHLADFIRQEGGSASWSPLVPIQSEGSRPPFYCVHARGGNVLSYRDLAQQLGPDQPVYGLQSIGLDGKQVPYVRIEDMARRYIEEIRKLQPEGPYYLGGSSMGGLVAYEMAQQLRLTGQEVGVLAMFDTWRPGYPKRMTTTNHIGNKLRQFGQRIDLHLGNLWASEGRERFEYIKTKSVKLCSLTKRWIRNRFKDLRQYLHDARHRLPKELRKIHKLNERAFYHYEPKSYSGKLILFRATKIPAGCYGDPYLGWGDLIESGVGVECYDIPGYHGALVYPPRVKLLARHLSTCLERAYADHSKPSQNPLDQKSFSPTNQQIRASNGTLSVV